MKMNRRNVLVGLGGIVASGGALLGTGAFSTVEADRDINIDTEGDGSAQLNLELAEELNGDGNTIEFAIENLNEEATTIFENALTIQDNRDDRGGLEVDILNDDESLVGINSDTDNAIFFVHDDGDEDYVTIGGGDSESFDVVFNTSSGDEGFPSSITIEANRV